MGCKVKCVSKWCDSSKDVKIYEGGLGWVGLCSDVYLNWMYVIIVFCFVLLNVWNRLIEVFDKKIGCMGLNFIEV